jgi:hypothetical protein
MTDARRIYPIYRFADVAPERIVSVHEAAFDWLRTEYTSDQQVPATPAALDGYAHSAFIQEMLLTRMDESPVAEIHTRLRLLKAAGRAATAGRLLYVALEQQARPECPPAELHDRSFNLLACLPPHHYATGSYWPVAPQRLSKYISGERAAGTVYRESVRFFMDKLVAYAPSQDGQLILPQPGGDDANSESWRPSMNARAAWCQYQASQPV